MTESMDDVLRAGAEQVATQDENSLAILSNLAKQQMELEDALAGKQLEAGIIIEQLAAIKDKALPEVFQSLGLEKLVMDDGSTVTCKTAYAVSIPLERADEAFEWFKQEGLDDMIKNETKATFGRGEEEQADKLAVILDEHNMNYVRKRFVHPQTLKSFVTKRLAEGSSIPDSITAHPVTQTKIKRPKI